LKYFSSRNKFICATSQEYFSSIVIGKDCPMPAMSNIFALISEKSFRRL